MSDSNKITDAEIIRDLAAANSTIQFLNDIPFVVYPKGYDLIKVEEALPHPKRIKATVTLLDEESFIYYFQRHEHEESVIFVGGPTDPSFTAIFDYHTQEDAIGDVPGWCSHRAEYDCPLSPEWQVWKGNDARKMNQKRFAEFIEENLDDIVTGESNHPSAADMLEVAHSLQAQKNISFSSGVRLSDGQVQLEYNEEIKGTTQKGKLAIPEKFYIGIPVFVNGTVYRLEAKFRYRIEDGSLTMWYDLHRPHKVIEDAYNGVLYRIQEKTKAVVFQGKI